ncbi:MAG TPA: sialidase family protein [Gaiellaceae bacterium]|nr:sialidase family protein [Gaiellaceae bacterium]
MRKQRLSGVGRTIALGAAALSLLLAAGGSAGSVIATPISSDPYMNPDSQHATQVEPDSYAFENTIVGTFQTGRFVNGGGASNIAWSTSTDGGRHWVTGTLPGTTVNAGGPWARISDPAVAYDPLHDVWMISTLGFGTPSSPSGSPSAILTSRSTDGGLTWQMPVTTSFGVIYDKNWITCDTWPTSPHYGNCYTEWDDNGQGNRVLMSTSMDGGLTWGPDRSPAGSPSGLGGQPVVQPNGNVVVPYEGAGIRAFRSTDGGATWSAAVTVSSISEHGVAGNLRTSPLPSAEVAGDGRVYVAWQDCRFRSGCPANDIVYSTSLDGVTWSAVTRVPIDPTTSTVDHFIPGLAVDKATSGSTTHLALGYYYYPVSNCGNSCQLTVGFVSSLDAGATWTAPTQVTGPMSLTWIANTDQGPMVGDYISTSFTGDGKAHPVFAIAKPKTGIVFSERAATATFDPTAPQVSPRVRVGTERPVYRGHRRPGDRKIRTTH